MRSSRQLAFGLVGLALAAGAPVGLLAMRLLTGRAALAALTHEWSTDWPTYVYVAASTAIVFTAFGAVLGHTADRLVTLATSDPLTGLLNRAGMRDRIAVEVRRVRREPAPLSLLLCDVDRMKQINDRYGHRIGDEALKQVARAIDRSCRASDSASRWGGDEFLILAPATALAEAHVLASRIREAARAGRTGLPVTVSIGVACALPSSEEVRPDELLQVADDALYRAKRAGRDEAEPPAI
jgi:diguanylate cyclase (GGDEF)-like protein